MPVIASPHKVRRNFRSEDSPNLLDNHLDKLGDNVNALIDVINNIQPGTIGGVDVNTGSNNTGSGGGGGNNPNPTPAPTGIPPIEDNLLLLNGLNAFVTRGTILGFIAGGKLIPALANNAALTRGLIIAKRDYAAVEPIDATVSGVHKALVDITNQLTNITPGDPCYLSWLVPGRTTNRLAPNPHKRLVLGFYLSTVDTASGFPLAWIGFTPNLQAMTGV